MKSLITLATALLMSLNTLAAGLQHVEPPNWWVGMRDTSLQLMLHGSGVADSQPTLAPYPGVTLKGSHRAVSAN